MLGVEGVQLTVSPHQLVRACYFLKGALSLFLDVYNPGMGGDWKCLLRVQSQPAGEARPVSQGETRLQNDITHLPAKWQSQEEARALQPSPFSERARSCVSGGGAGLP